MNLYKTTIAITIVIIPTVSYGAGRLEDVAVTEVWANKNGMGVVRFESILSDSASCSTGHYKNSVAIDLETHGGRTMESIALAALASGKKLQFKVQGVAF